MSQLVAQLRRHPGLALVLASYLVLGVIYGLSTPTFEASDELYHYMFVKELVDGRGLPVQTPRGDNPALQEASQPPLYYLLAAAATSWINTGPLEQTYKLNPHAEKGVPDAFANKNMVIHGPEEHFPWTGPVLAVHLIRLLSLLLGAATVLLSYAVARELLPERPSAALGAAALTAFIPQFIFIAAAVNNDNMVTMLGSLALLLSLRLIRGVRSRRQLVLLGVVVGLAALAKVSGLAALPLALAAIAWNAWRERRVSRLIADSAVVIGSAAVVAGWWYVRNWQLYGDPLGLSAMIAVAGSRPPGFGLGDLLKEQEGLRWSFWGVFGGFNVIAGRWVYWVYDLLSAAAGIGILAVLLRAIRRRSANERGIEEKWGRGPNGDTPPKFPQFLVRQRKPRDRERLAQWALALFWLVLLLVGLVKWSLSTMGTQGRLLYPALPTVATLLFVGLAAWLPRPRLSDRHLVSVLAPGLALLAAYLPFAYIAPAYKMPPLAGKAQIANAPNPLEVNFADRILLAGYSVDRHAAQPGDVVQVTLYWQTLAPMAKDYSLFIHVYAPDGSTAAQVDSYPGGGSYATSQLAPGTALRDRYELRLSPETSPGMSQIAMGFYDMKTKAMLPARDGQGRPLNGAVPLSTLRVVARAEGVPTSGTGGSAKQLDANLGDQVALTGYRLDGVTVQPGGTINGTLYWQALARMKDNYTTFVHLLGPNGLVAQYDGEPLGGEYHTSDWTPGDRIGDPFTIHLPELPAGNYRLVAGMYRLQGGERLPIERNPLDRLWQRLRPAAGQPDSSDAVQLTIVHVR